MSRLLQTRDYGDLGVAVCAGFEEKLMHSGGFVTNRMLRRGLGMVSSTV